LISLGADFNKRDSMGRTPLDFARITARGGLESNVQMKEFEVGQKMVIGEEMIIEKGLTRTVEFTSSYFESQSQSIAQSAEPQPTDEGENMIDLLLSIGATAGSNRSREDQLLSPLVVAAARHTTNGTRGLSPEPEEDTAKAGSAENGFGSDSNYCVSYRVLDSRISERLHDLSHALTPEESLELVGDMRKREQFRRKYGSRILCLDGGGIRGLVTLSILQEIERKMNKKITEIFDWIVGTSTGGILALGLCYGE
jgi:CRISPR/Cas system CMR-associated protein Cmr5 small subunit